MSVVTGVLLEDIPVHCDQRASMADNLSGSKRTTREERPGFWVKGLEEAQAQTQQACMRVAIIWMTLQRAFKEHLQSFAVRPHWNPREWKLTEVPGFVHVVLSFW